MRQGICGCYGYKSRCSRKSDSLPGQCWYVPLSGQPDLWRTEEILPSLNHGDFCPSCNGAQVSRMRRKGVLAAIPASKFYRCSRCRAKYIQLFGFVTLRLRGAASGLVHSNSGTSRKKALAKLWSILVGLLMFIFLSYYVAVTQYESGPSKTAPKVITK